MARLRTTPALPWKRYASAALGQLILPSTRPSQPRHAYGQISSASGRPSKVSFGSLSDFQQRSHEVRFALWTGPRRRSTHRCWRNDIPAPVAQFVAHQLLQASSRRRRNPKRYRLFKHQAEDEVAPLGSASYINGLASSRISVSNGCHAPNDNAIYRFRMFHLFQQTR
jgi:hypothetical protein